MYNLATITFLFHDSYTLILIVNVLIAIWYISFLISTKQSIIVCQNIINTNGSLCLDSEDMFIAKQRDQNILSLDEQCVQKFFFYIPVTCTYEIRQRTERQMKRSTTESSIGLWITRSMLRLLSSTG